MRCSCLMAAAMMLQATSAHADGPSPVPGFTIVTPKADGIEAIDINGRGEVIGFEWAEEAERPGVVAQRPFFARGDAMTYIPLLAGYTAAFPAALGDDGLVVGWVSKPVPPGVRVPMRTQAFVWDARGGIRGLGTLAGDDASAATGVSGDGRRVSGYSVGEKGRRAVVWERDGDGWRATALPHESSLGSPTVAISDDGKVIAALDGAHACLWSEGPAGGWTREAIAEAGALAPRAVNNAGMVVGIRHAADANSRAVVWERGQGVRVIELPAGYVRSEANAVNNAGVVVGMMDGPRGGLPGPAGFAYERGQLRVLAQGDLPFAGATAINDRRQVAGTLEKDEELPAPDAGDKP